MSDVEESVSCGQGRRWHFHSRARLCVSFVAVSDFKETVSFKKFRVWLSVSYVAVSDFKTSCIVSRNFVCGYPCCMWL
jgi:hypothetical protein